MTFSKRAQAISGLGGDKWALHFAAKEKIESGQDIISLSIGEPELLPPPMLGEVAKSAIDAGRVGYTNGPGELALRKILADKYTERAQRLISTDQVLITAGTQNALYLTFQTLVGPGDEVLVTDPLYATYEGVVRATGAEPVSIYLRPEMNFHVQVDDIKRKITSKTKALLLNSPQNPTGAVLTEKELNKIGDLAKANNFWIVSDEVYEELVFPGSKFASAFDNSDFADRTVALSSISKSHAAAGYRAGWLVASKEFCAAALPILETDIFGTPPFIQDAAAAVLAKGPSALAPTMRANYARRAKMVFDELDGFGNLKVTRPEAGMFVLIDARISGQTSTEFGRKLLEEAGVAVMPGSSFGKALEGFVRVSLTVDDDVLVRALSQIKKVI